MLLNIVVIAVVLDSSNYLSLIGRLPRNKVYKVNPAQGCKGQYKLLLPLFFPFNASILLLLSCWALFIFWSIRKWDKVGHRFLVTIIHKQYSTPPQSRHTRSTMSATHHRQQSPLPPPPPRINRMHSVNDLVSTKSLQSPLTQLRVGVESRKDEAVRSVDATCILETTMLMISLNLRYSIEQYRIHDPHLRMLSRRAPLHEHLLYPRSNLIYSERLRYILSIRYRQ